jgi:hypothetical protein
MITIEKLIKDRPETVEFLVMALLNMTYDGQDMQTFRELFCEPDILMVEALRQDATCVEVGTVDCDQSTGTLYVQCGFRGHEGFPGGEFSKPLGIWTMVVSEGALTYMLISNAGKIEQARKEHKQLVESGNNE